MPGPPPPAPQADKRYQLADWRARPLTRDMLHYARADTHFLLYIHDRMKQELLARGRGEDAVPAGLVVPLPPGAGRQHARGAVHAGRRS